MMEMLKDFLGSVAYSQAHETKCGAPNPSHFNLERGY